jgi:hypothetical protein
MVSSCLALAGCAGLGGLETPQRVVSVPDEKKLAEIVGTVFKAAKLAGNAEVSPVRATHDTQRGDWAVCVKGSAADQPRYAVLIRDGTIIDYRTQVAIDGCDTETYRPIDIVGQPAVPIAKNVDTAPAAQRRHQPKPQ